MENKLLTVYGGHIEILQIQEYLFVGKDLNTIIHILYMVLRYIYNIIGIEIGQKIKQDVVLKVEENVVYTLILQLIFFLLYWIIEVLSTSLLVDPSY